MEKMESNPLNMVQQEPIPTIEAQDIEAKTHRREKPWQSKAQISLLSQWPI